MMRYVATTRSKGETLELVWKILKAFAIVEIIIAVIFLVRGEMKLAESTDVSEISMQQRPSVKEQAYLYIKDLEVPEEIQVESVERMQYRVKIEDDCKNYNPTEEERQMAYLIAKSEAGIEDSFGQTLVINVAINDMKERGYSSLIEEFNASGRYSSMKNGVPSIYIKAEDKWIPVTEDMLSDELKAAVDMAFEKDYTEELLKEVAEAKGLDETYYKDGALYFYNPKAVSDYQASIRANIQVSFQYGRHVFYRVWDK